MNMKKWNVSNWFASHKIMHDSSESIIKCQVLKLHAFDFRSQQYMRMHYFFRFDSFVFYFKNLCFSLSSVKWRGNSHDSVKIKFEYLTKWLSYSKSIEQLNKLRLICKWAHYPKFLFCLPFGFGRYMFVINLHMNKNKRNYCICQIHSALSLINWLLLSRQK